MNNPEEITAIILARGKSFRMKMEKGLVLFNGKMLVEHVIEAIKIVTSNIIIITANAQYKQFDYPCFADELENKTKEPDSKKEVREKKPVSIKLLPLGKINSALISTTLSDMKKIVSDVELLPHEEMPASAFYAPRNRYRADTLLD